MPTLVEIDAYAIPNRTVVCAGTVKNGDGAPLQTMVTVYADNDLSIAKASGSSDVSGNFSITVPGAPHTLFTVVAKNNQDANSVIYSNCRT